MKVEDFFSQHNIIDLSFFNFSNAITAAYFAKENLEILKINENFRKFFPTLGNVNNGNYSGLKEGCLSPQMSSPISGSSPLKVASSEGSSSRPCFFSVERYERMMQKA